jgi:hypothetical protein
MQKDLMPRVLKLITRDVYLEKELDRESVVGDDPRYIFKIISKSQREVQLTADFAGSDRVEFYDDFNGPPLTI